MTKFTDLPQRMHISSGAGAVQSLRLRLTCIGP